MKKKVLVGMSGGLDSAVTSLLLKKQGYEVVGVFFALSGADESVAERQAADLAQKLDIKFEVYDGRELFQKNVLTKLLSAYEKGMTPNPCILCNPSVKFKLLFFLAEQKAIPYVATGHYARIVEEESGPAIARGVDEKKDQSYMLYRLPREWLSSIVFPLGDLRKEEVREIAKSFLPEWVVQKKESQDVCFAPEGLDDFLNFHLSDKKTCQPGSIMDESGKEIRTHNGLWRYTIGQRKGLGLPGGPWFVVSKNIVHNILRVSRKKELSSLRIWCEAPVMYRYLTEGAFYMAEHRYRTRPFSVMIESVTEQAMVVRGVEICPVVAPGQSLVLYNKDVVCGGGIIISSEEVSPCQ